MSDESRKYMMLNRAKLMLKLVGKHGKLCWYCGHPFSSFNEVHLNHIVPPCRGGKYVLHNLAIACEPCKGAKGQKSLQEFLHWLRRPKAPIPAMDARAKVPEEQWNHYGEEIEKGLRKPSSRS